MKTRDDIERVCDGTKNLLIKKNADYGDSALEPLGVFGNGDAITSLGARMDDKLMRLKTQGIGKHSIDTLYDLHGYIALMIIAIERKENIDSSAHICNDDSNTSDTLKKNSNNNTNDERNDISQRKANGQTALSEYTTSTGADPNGWETSSTDREGKTGR